MTQDEIIEMARQAGFKMENSAAIQAAKAFAKLVSAKEREACAKLCEEVGEHPSLTPLHCAESIRARTGEKA
jgi:hypothetical protein